MRSAALQTQLWCNGCCVHRGLGSTSGIHGLTAQRRQLLPADLLLAAGRSAKTFGLASHCRLVLPNLTPFALHQLLLEEAALACSTPVAKNSFVTRKHAGCWRPPCQPGGMATGRLHLMVQSQRFLRL